MKTAKVIGKKSAKISNKSKNLLPTAEEQAQRNAQVASLLKGIRTEEPRYSESEIASMMAQRKDAERIKAQLKSEDLTAKVIQPGITGRDLKRINKEATGRTGVKKVQKVKATEPTPVIEPTPVNPLEALFTNPAAMALLKLLGVAIPEPKVDVPMVKEPKVKEPKVKVNKVKIPTRIDLIARVLLTEPTLAKDDVISKVDALYTKETGKDLNTNQTTTYYLLVVQILKAFNFWPLE